MKNYKKFSENAMVRASNVLDRGDRRKSMLIFFAYIIMGFLDVLAILIIGIVGSLAVSGISSNQPGDRVKWLLKLAQLENATLQLQVGVLGLISATILIAKSLISLYLSKRILFFLSRRAAYISYRLINQFFSKDIMSIREKTTQETIYALTTGVNTILVSVYGASLLLASDVLLLIIFGLTLFFVDTTVAVSSLIFFVGLGLLLYRFMHIKATNLGENATKLAIRSSDKIAEVVLCYRELLVKNRRSFYARQIGGMRLEIAETTAKLSIMNFLSKYIMEISMVVGGVFVGAIQFLTQPATRAVAVISVFLVSSARIVPGVLRVQTGLIGIKAAIATAQPTLDLIEQNFDIREQSRLEDADPYPSSFEHEGFRGEIQIRNLIFRYPTKSSNAVEVFDFSVKEGEFIGVVGPSGAGKSTLVDLLLGVLNTKHETISISGVDAGESIKKWPGAIGYVPQDSNFINGTVKENVCFGYDATEVPDEHVIKVLRAAQLEDILNLPEGINTFIGEQGSKLSGGQRQRLGIARALFTNPRLLILDEATSALDANTEAKLTEYLESLKGSLTLIVIAHRLSTVRSADRILYLEKGKVLGVGSFEELRNGLPEFNAQASAMGITG
jgi:ABC-type multidrug transport system fused ATPase/permease subunit